MSNAADESVRSRCFVMTINNPTPADEEALKVLKDKTRYIIVGKEVGANGTPHFQCYCYFNTLKSFSFLKKSLPRAHIEVAIASCLANVKYCSKDGNLFLEHGVKPNQGKRSDIESAVALLKGGSNVREVIDVAKSYQSIKVAEVWMKYNEKGRKWKPEVRWYHGSTGSGKTRSAVEWLGEDYYVPVSFKWWEGYDAHPNVLLDDIRGDFCKYHDMLKLIDRYQYRVESKGGSRQFLAKKIAITSPYHPKDIWNISEDKSQLFRRIDQVVLSGEEVNVYEIEVETDSE